MIAIVFLYQILGLSGFFNPDLRQYRMKSALFTSGDPDFSALPRCCVLKCTQGRTQGVGVNPPLELDILQKLYYLRKEIKCFRILFAC